MSLSAKTIFLIVLAFCLVSCQQAPEPTSVPLSAPTFTPPPQPTATTDPLALRFTELPEQTTLQGGAFLSLDISAFLRYRRFSVDRMTWNAAGSEHIDVSITDGVIAAALNDPAWIGSEAVQVEACDPDGRCATGEIVYSVLEAGAFSDVSVTYLGNCGFLIAVGDKKVLVDAIFAGSAGAYMLPYEVREPLLNATPPFDGVDLILATHDHTDHFTASMVRQHMRNNPDAVFVSTTQAAGQLAEFGERVIAMDPVEGVPVFGEANGIQVEAIYLSHGYPPNDPEETFNNAYVVTIGSLRFFHTGDINDLRDGGQYDLAGVGIDLAFISHSYMVSGTSRSTLEDVVKADYLFPMHFQQIQSASARDAIRVNYPDAILFDQALETWRMPLPGN